MHRMFTIGPKFRQIVFAQPRRVGDGLQAKTGFSLSPQARPFIALMDQLEARVSKQVQSSLPFSAVNQETRSPLGQPFVIESRDGIEPTSALRDCFWPQRGESFIPLDHDLRMKRDCL